MSLYNRIMTIDLCSVSFPQEYDIFHMVAISNIKLPRNLLICHDIVTLAWHHLLDSEGMNKLKQEKIFFSMVLAKIIAMQ